MNNFVTYCARAKLTQMLEGSEAKAAKIITNKLNGLGVEFTNSDFSGVLLCLSPKIYTSMATLKLLNSSSIDFDYRTDDFILTKAM
jgi:hypothetical protein